MSMQVSLTTTMTMKKRIININDDTNRDYYCNVKFQGMKIDLEKNLTYNCDAARPHQIDFNWLDKNPGQLFNNVITVNERNMMLQNDRNSSCEQNCFSAEDVGAISPRLIRKGYNKSHIDPIANVKILDLTIGSDCNLTCTYCLKEFSSAWRKDLEHYGNYPIIFDDERYMLNNKDVAISKLSQNEKYNKKTFQKILQEIKLMSENANVVIITGGEPLLNNKLFDILDMIKHVAKIKVFSGLGISLSRLDKILNRIKDLDNIEFILSCENIDSYFEFNRYGNIWTDYEKKLNLLVQSKINFKFHSTLSNLSLFGFYDFLQKFRDNGIEYDFVHKPDFMAVYVMDDQSKNRIRKFFENDVLPWKDQIFKSLEVNPTELQIQNLKIFLKEFAKRRNIDISDLYPKSFIKWINL